MGEAPAEMTRAEPEYNLWWRATFDNNVDGFWHNWIWPRFIFFFVKPSSYIWSNFIRTHIGLKICHFLLSVGSITESPKNQIMRKSGIHSSVPCQDSTLEQFLFWWVSKKNGKIWCFLGSLFYGSSVVLIDVLCYSCGSKRCYFLHFVRTP